MRHRDRLSEPVPRQTPDDEEFSFDIDLLQTARTSIG
jgi:hypothetical protein